MKHFKAEGPCLPSEHYMVDMKDRIVATSQMIHEGKYFYIQRPRQYGKTTMLMAIARFIRDQYLVIPLNFQRFSQDDFIDTKSFLYTIWDEILSLANDEDLEIPEDLRSEITQAFETSRVNFIRFGRMISKWSKLIGKPAVLIIDELDRAPDETIVRSFLGFLRGDYLSRYDRKPTFHSVILAGVTNIVYLKSVIRKDEEHREDSPWNIAADYSRVDMAFSVKDTSQMLLSYEADHHTGMDISSVSEEIVYFTNGYPYLVSRICQLIDEVLLNDESWSALDAWSVIGVREAAKRIIQENNTLFDSLKDTLNSFPYMKSKLHNLLMYGKSLSYEVDDTSQRVLLMYGFLRVHDGNQVWVSNRIFETRLYNLFIGEDEKLKEVVDTGATKRSKLVDTEHLNMHAIMDAFADLYEELYHNQTPKFLEKDGRKLFITYLRRMINGTGHYAVEDNARDEYQTDLIVFYMKDKYLIELKIWNGDQYENDGLNQLADYLDAYNLDLGYLLSFSFLKKKDTRRRAVSHQVKGKTILEWVV